jgi:radical SAM superfamily enzyme YgiQ (UPF0313 family)
MKVLLMNPPPLEKGEVEQSVIKYKALHFPTWLAYAAAYLEKKGHEVLLLDAPARKVGYHEVEKSGKQFKPDLLVVGASIHNTHGDTKAAARLKRALGGAFTIMVGAPVSSRPEEILDLEPAIDAVARREFDVAVASLADVLASDSRLDVVEGITYRSNGHVHTNPVAPLLQNLDDIPFVSEIYKRFLDARNYFNPNVSFPMITILTGRGCAYGCTFCAHPAFSGRRIRYRSIDNIVEELEYIAREFPGVKGVFFEDETLTMNRQRCRDLCQALIDRRLRFSWTANCRPDLDVETLKIMKRAGCRTVCAGFESGNQEILNRVRKNMTPAKMRQFVSHARTAGVLVHGCFIAGLPGETRKTLEETLALSKNLNPDTAQFLPFVTYADNAHGGFGNHSWDRNQESRLSEEPMHCRIRPGELTLREITQFCERAHKEFYGRFGYPARQIKLMLLRPREIRQTWKTSRFITRSIF